MALHKVDNPIDGLSTGIVSDFVFLFCYGTPLRKQKHNGVQLAALKLSTTRNASKTTFI
jgi:hypothetical protein